MRWMLPFATAAVCLAAAPSAQAYEKPAIAVFEPAGDPFAEALRESLARMPRFRLLAVGTSGAYDSLDAFLARAKQAHAASGHAAPAYALVPRHAFGPMTSTPPKTEDALKDGIVHTTVYSEIRSEFTFALDVYEVATGKRLDTLSYLDTLSRRFEYHYDANDSERTIHEKALRLTSALNVEAARRPAEAFSSQAQGNFVFLTPRLLLDVRKMRPFQLDAAVTGWDARRDRIFLGLGRELDVQLDDGFKILQDGREVGFVKLRHVGELASEGEPVFLDASLRRGDRLVEHPKFNNWQGLKAGVAFLGGPAFVGTYSAELDIGSWIGLSELYGAADLSLLTTGAFSGRMGELGLTKRFFMRRWGLGLGARGGVAMLSGLTGEATALGGAGVLSLACYLTPDLVWNSELGFQSYTPVMQQGGAAGGTLVQPFGPFLKTGLSWVF